MPTGELERGMVGLGGGVGLPVLGVGGFPLLGVGGFPRGEAPLGGGLL